MNVPLLASTLYISFMFCFLYTAFTQSALRPFAEESSRLVTFRDLQTLQTMAEVRVSLQLVCSTIRSIRTINTTNKFILSYVCVSIAFENERCSRATHIRNEPTNVVHRPT